MNWLIYAFSAIFSLATFDFLLKLTVGKMHSSLAGFIANLTGAIVILIFLVYSLLQNEKVFATKPGGILIAIIAGAVVGLSNIFILKTYGTGISFSLAQPFIRVGVVVLGSLAGIILLKEGFTVKYVVGLSLSLIGLSLLLGK
jgi:uncharacterized membrane protein